MKLLNFAFQKQISKDHRWDQWFGWFNRWWWLFHISKTNDEISFEFTTHIYDVRIVL
jgi:hypothetical protein